MQWTYGFLVFVEIFITVPRSGQRECREEVVQTVDLTMVRTLGPMKKGMATATFYLLAAGPRQPVCKRQL